MKITQTLIILLLIFLSLSSCQDVYDYDLDDYASIDDVFDYEDTKSIDNIDSSDDVITFESSDTIVSNDESFVSSTFVSTSINTDTAIHDDEYNTESSHDTQNTNVWKSKSGSKYHSKPTCSNMKSAIEISLVDAVLSGLEPCKKCF